MTTRLRKPFRMSSSDGILQTPVHTLSTRLSHSCEHANTQIQTLVVMTLNIKSRWLKPDWGDNDMRYCHFDLTHARPPGPPGRHMKAWFICAVKNKMKNTQNNYLTLTIISSRNTTIMHSTMLSTTMGLALPTCCFAMPRSPPPSIFGDGLDSYIKGFHNPRIGVSVRGQAICISGTINVTASAKNVLFKEIDLQDQSAVTDFLVEGF